MNETDRYISRFPPGIEVAAFKHARGSVQFPFDQPIPVELVERIVRFRVLENS